MPKPPPRGEKATRRERPLTWIIGEGDTERDYFMQMSSVEMRVKMVSHATSGNTPAKLLDKLLQKRAEEQAENPQDRAFVVCDSDATPPAEMDAVCADADAARVTMAVSHPCFEYFLVCHFTDPPPRGTSSAQMKARLQSHLPAYNKRLSPAHIARLKTGCDAACARTRAALDEGDRDAAWPRAGGSMAFRVFEPGTVKQPDV